MKGLYLLIGLLIVVASVNCGYSQDPDLYHFKFEMKQKSEVDRISTLISIDNFDGNFVYAYANQKEFEAFKKLKIPFTFIESAKLAKAITMAYSADEMLTWDKYPAYDVYEAMMFNFANQYPDICLLHEIGTLPSGRKLWALKISNSISENDVAKPQLMLSSSMHGDEVAGYILLLRLADYLLSNFNKPEFTTVTKLINEGQLWINPLANPDGTYKAGNQTISGASRYNANLVDLNRNFPDPAAGLHPDGNDWQPETEFMMDFASAHPINLSMNIHSGAELVNFPWDTWSRATADEAWWIYVGGNYRNAAQANSPDGYLTDVSNGLSNGYDWYRITGGRQDYMNYFKNSRELTLEISSTKLYPSESLNSLWSYNREALIGYLTEGLYGIQGTVTNSLGQPLAAKISVLNHDLDESEVYASTETGFFARYLKAGTYNLKISADGYADYYLSNHLVEDAEQYFYPIVLETPLSRLCINQDTLKIRISSGEIVEKTVPFYNCGNLPVVYSVVVEDTITTKWISITRPEGTVAPGNSGSISLGIDPTNLTAGIYQAAIYIVADSSYRIPISLTIIDTGLVQISKHNFTYKLVKPKSLVDSFWIENKANFPIEFDLVNNQSWLHLEPYSGTIAANDRAKINLTILPQQQVGAYRDRIVLSGAVNAQWNVLCTFDTMAVPKLQKDSLWMQVFVGQQGTDSVSISNAGGGLLDVLVDVPVDMEQYLTVSEKAFSLNERESKTVFFTINTLQLNPGKHNFLVPLYMNDSLSFIPIELLVEEFPELRVWPDSIYKTGCINQLIKDSIAIANMGGATLNYTVLFPDNQIPAWLYLEKMSGQINSGQSAYLNYVCNANLLDTGSYSTSLAINDVEIPIVFHLNEEPTLQLNKHYFFVTLNASQTDTLVLTNSGGSPLHYTLWLNQNLDEDVINIGRYLGYLEPNQMETILLTFSVQSMQEAVYNNRIVIKTGNQTYRIPVQIIKQD